MRYCKYAGDGGIHIIKKFIIKADSFIHSFCAYFCLLTFSTCMWKCVCESACVCKSMYNIFDANTLSKPWLLAWVCFFSCKEFWIWKRFFLHRTHVLHSSVFNASFNEKWVYKVVPVSFVRCVLAVALLTCYTEVHNACASSDDDIETFSMSSQWMCSSMWVYVCGTQIPIKFIENWLHRANTFHQTIFALPHYRNGKYVIRMKIETENVNTSWKTCVCVCVYWCE